MKVQIYAEAGIREVWLVLLPEEAIEIYSAPVEGVYQEVRRARKGEVLPLPHRLGGAVEVSDILGRDASAGS
jgi:Uma2 family endonuclease